MILFFPRAPGLLALSALCIALAGCDSSDDSDCSKGRPGCGPTTTSSTVGFDTTTSSSTTSSSSTSMPFEAHACCLPDSSCDAIGERQCENRGGIWEPGGQIGCLPGICDDPGGFHGEFEVTLSVTNAETLGALQIDVDYDAVPGSFNGADKTVECTRLVGDFGAFNDKEAERTLSIAIISTAGFTGPIDIARCNYCCPPRHDPSDYVVAIRDQSRPDFTPANATVAVTSVRATGATTTTITLPN